MKLLVIEDDPKHLEDAKNALKEHSDIETEFVSTLKDFEEATKNNHYDGIISDIFFPFDENEEEGKPKGWSYNAMIACLELLVGNGVNYGDHFQLNDFTRNVVEASDRWVDGLAMHPSGVVVVKNAKEKNIPIVLCTDTYHHGYVTQPVATFASKMDVPLIDSYEGGYENSAPQKDWKKAIEMLLEIIKK